MREFTLSLLLLSALTPTLAFADRKVSPAAAMRIPAHGIPGVPDQMLSPYFWVARAPDADAVVMTPEAIAAQNAKLLALDPSMHRLADFGAQIEGAQVRGWIERLSKLPSSPLFDAKGAPVPAETLAGLRDALAIEAIPASQPARFGLVVRRASLRAFPTALRVFNNADDSDIDRFQESALFVGTPVLIVHRSLDGQWLFVASPNYAAWIEAIHVAEGAREDVLAYPESAPFRLITGARASLVYTPEEPRVSALPLEMGARLALADVPPDRPVNGQHPYATWPLRVPVRGEDGRLSFVPALLPRNADSSPAPLPLTRANLIRQAFKFLGERYGWGHSYDGRDCSGFVSEVYRSMGVELPRNTSDQGRSPAFDRLDFDSPADAGRRLAAVESLQIGDLVYIPGHVMMVIGRVDSQPYVIHDTNGGSFLDATGQVRSRHLNSVSVTPLLPLRFSATASYVDRMNHIVRIRHP